MEEEVSEYDFSLVEVEDTAGEIAAADSGQGEAGPVQVTGGDEEAPAPSAGQGQAFPREGSHKAALPLEEEAAIQSREGSLATGQSRHGSSATGEEDLLRQEVVKKRERSFQTRRFIAKCLMLPFLFLVVWLLQVVATKYLMGIPRAHFSSVREGCHRYWQFALRSPSSVVSYVIPMWPRSVTRYHWLKDITERLKTDAQLKQHALAVGAKVPAWLAREVGLLDITNHDIIDYSYENHPLADHPLAASSKTAEAAEPEETHRLHEPPIVKVEHPNQNLAAEPEPSKEGSDAGAPAEGTAEESHPAGGGADHPAEGTGGAEDADSRAASLKALWEPKSSSLLEKSAVNKDLIATSFIDPEEILIVSQRSARAGPSRNRGEREVRGRVRAAQSVDTGPIDV